MRFLVLVIVGVFISLGVLLYFAHTKYNTLWFFICDEQFPAQQYVTYLYFQEGGWEFKNSEGKRVMTNKICVAVEQ